MKFVYFDIGGVLEEDFSNTNNLNLLLDDLGVLKENIGESIVLFNEFEKEACCGRNVEEFLPILEHKFKIKFPKNYSLNKDFIDRFKINKGIDEIIENVKNKYQLGLLTNMYPEMLKMIQDKNLIPKINWQVIIDSSVEKCKKPERRIYEIAENKSGFKGDEILFIDNRKENLEVPQKMGWQTFWFNSSDYKRSNQELAEILR